MKLFEIPVYALSKEVLAERVENRIRSFRDRYPDFDFSNSCLATTSFVVKDDTADLLNITSQIGDITVNAVNPNFEISRVEGLKNYTEGFIKEGAGAGGAMFLALMLGNSIDEIRESIEDACS